MAGAALPELACRRIADLGKPAYVKDSELRYVAVNAAYAQFFARETSDFIGRRSRELFDTAEEQDREDKERRALVFGEEEFAGCFSPAGHRHRLSIESFICDKGRSYILGVFEEPLKDTKEPGLADTELLRALLNDLPVPLCVGDAQHRLVFANQAFFDQTGFSSGEWLGKTLNEMLASNNSLGGAHAATLEARHSTVLSQAKTIETEELITDRNGRTHPILLRSSPLSLPGDRHFVASSFINMQSLKVSERDMLEARQQMELLHRELEHTLRALPVGVVVLDDHYHVVYISDEFLRLWNIPVDDVYEGKPYLDVIQISIDRCTRDNKSTASEILAERIVAIEQGLQEPLEIAGADGQCVLFGCRRLSSNRILLTYTDVSPIRARELEAEEARAALTSLGELMHDATQAIPQGMLVARDGVILLANQGAREVLQLPQGYVLASLNWRTLFRFFARRGDFGNSPRCFLSRWRPMIAQGRPIVLQPYLVGDRWIKMEAFFTEKRHWVAVFTDVTDSKEKEGDLQRLLALSEAADRTKSEFLASIGHEIRTPMNGVLAMAELLAKTGLEPRQRTFLDVIVKSGRALLTIINDILDFSRIEAGDMRLRKTVFDPLEAAEDIATLLSAQAGEKNIQLLVRSQPKVPALVVGDAGRFRQIVTALVSNAVRFTEHGHVLIDLACVDGAGDEVMLILRVEDTGIGIPPDRLQTIFEKFSHADKSYIRRHEGTGLGLAITAGLVDLFGGYVDVQSTVGQGSAFTAHLPLLASRRTHNVRDIAGPLKGARILVIDSEDISRKILIDRLQQAQYEAVGVETSDLGLAVLTEAAALHMPVDAVIVDHNPAGQVNLDVLHRIRQNPELAGIPVVLLASIAIPDAVSELSELDCQTCLMKPVRSSTLLKAVEDVVREARISSPISNASQDAADLAAVFQEPASSSVDVLVAEDNEINQIVFRQILEAAGFTFHIAANGREAVQAWEELQPGLIMMDITMPVMSGVEATRLIRKRELLSSGHVPIIAVTAHAHDADREEYLAAGMDDHIVKPISPEALEEKIRFWLNAKRQPGMRRLSQV